MHSERDHATYSPSQAERIFGCPGSVRFLRSVPPRPSSIHAEMGTKAHEVLEAGIRNGCRRGGDAVEVSFHCLEDFDDDFKGAITKALNYIWQLYAEVSFLHGDAIIFSEIPVRVDLDVAPGEADGHLDIAIYSPKAGVLHILDYKHGQGVAKDVRGNKQLLQYAYGFVFDGRYLDNPFSLQKITLHILQPRAFHPEGDMREWDVTLPDLINYKAELRDAVVACQAPDAPLVPDTKADGYCFFCDGRTTCPALESKALAVAANTTFATIRDIRSPNLPDPKNLDIERLVYIKKAGTMLTTWLSQIDKHIEELVRSGVEIPGFKLVETAPRREYYGEEKERIEKLAALIGCEKTDLYKVYPKGITEVEDMIVTAFKQRVGRSRRNQAAEEARQLFAYFTIKQSSGSLMVVPDNDPRPAINIALRSFETIEGILPPPTSGV